jgi:predicted RecA/RadA family phage recombinase
MAKNKWFDAGYVPFTTAAAITKHQMVKLTAANTVNICGAGEAAIGVCMQTTASGAEAPIKLLNAPGTFPCIAASAIAAGAAVYTAAAGKVNDVQTGSGAIVGIAKDAASADTDAVEILREYVVAST